MANELWNKYCSFYDMNFEKQVEHNKAEMEKHFKNWKNTKTAEIFNAKNAVHWNDVPLTKYSDYKFLIEYGKKLEEREKNIKRNKGESLYDYYTRITSPLVKEMGLEDYLIGNYGATGKTSGSTGKSKWVIHSELVMNRYKNTTMAIAIFGASDEWGETNLKKGDRALNLISTVPYMGGYSIKFFESFLTLVPSLETTDNISSIRKKMYITLKAIENEGVEIAGGIPSFFNMLVKKFKDPSKLYKQYMEYSKGFDKFLMMLAYLSAKIKNKKYEDIREIMPLKAIIIGGYGSDFYNDVFEKEFKIKPIQAYGSTEVPLCLMGDTNSKLDMFPKLDDIYHQFVDNDGNILEVNELKTGETYEYIATYFDSIFMKYESGDLLKVVHKRDDGMPYFKPQGRKNRTLDFYGYFRITEASAIDTFYNSKLKIGEMWAVEKVIEPKEKVRFLLEKQDMKKEKVEKILFESLKNTNQFFRNYVEDFNVKEASEIIEVEYLKKGVFFRYSMKKQKEGVPLGQIKPPHIITENMSDSSKALRS